MSAESGTVAGDDQQITFNVKASNDQKYVLTLPASSTVGDLKQKLSTSEYADIPVERLRLIYSGRVLKDPDSLASTKIKDGHTIHMVKGAASNVRQNPAAQSSTSSTGTGSSPAPAANVPTNIAAGTGNNPLAALTGARYAGFHGLPSASMFGPDGGLGPPPGPEELLRLMEDPNVMQQVNEAMNNPAFQQMLEQSPQIRNNPVAREMLRNPNLRRLMFDPRMIRMNMEMTRAMGGGAAGAFPAPGVTDITPQAGQQEGDNTGTQNQNTAGTGAGAGAANPLAGLFGSPPAGGEQANPFAALFGAPPTAGTPMAATTGTTSPPTTGSTSPGAASPGTTTNQDQQNPFANLGAFMELMQALGPPPGQGDEVGAAANPFAGLFGMQPPAPPDNRPPEERYAEQLRQLNDMGFYEFERNIEALRRSGGSVQGAVEYLLGGGGS